MLKTGIRYRRLLAGCLAVLFAAIPTRQTLALRPAAQAEMLPDAPAFDLKATDGKIIHLGDYRGSAVLLNFWATWCVPCKQEMPWLVDFQKQYGPRGLVVLGISMDSSAEPVRRYLRKQPVNYPILMGTQAIADQYFVKGLPASIYIDRNGKITDQVPGLASRSVMENEIKLALENAVATSKPH
jgi:cytochrome c biogenesis protein CcmG/thiol:disulfide interchange protein DsbE